MSNNHMASCPQNTCFANFDKKCMCLTNGRFENECPFYKTEAQVKAERKKSQERHKKLGLVQGIKSKYGGGIYELD